MILRETNKKKNQSTKDSIFYALTNAFIVGNFTSNWFQVFLFWLSNLQVVPIFLFIQLEFVLSGKGDIFTSFVHKLSKALTLVDVLNNFDESFAGIVAGFAWLYSLIVISVFLIILYRYYLKSKLSRKEKTFVTNLSQFHQTVGFYISIIILMQLAANSSDLVKVEDHDAEDNMFNTRTLISLHVFFITTNYLCGLVFAFLSYHPFPSENPLGTRSSGVQMILFVAKALLIPVVFADGTEDNTYLMWTVNIIALLVFGSRYLFTFQTFHYFDSLAMGISANSSLIATIISFTNIIGLSISDKSSKEINAILYSEVLISILVIKLSEVNFNGILERSFDKKENTVNNVMIKFFLLRKLWKKAKSPLDKNGQRDQNEFQLKGIFKYYIEQDSKMLDSEEALNFVMSELLTNAIKTLRKSDDIKLIFAYFLISQNINPTKAILYLLQICKDKRSFNFISANYLLNSGNLLENSKTSSSSSIDLKSFLDFETASTQFTQQVYSISKEYVEFWKNYYGPSLEIMDLLRKSRSLEKKAEIISHNWERYSRIYPNFGISLITMYAAYVKLVRNAPYSAFKLESKARSLRVWREKLLAKYDPDSLESPNNIVLEVSLDSKNTGKIIYASPNTLEYLGWTQKEMIHQHISNFMLPSLRDKFHRNFFESEGFENSMVVKLDSKIDLFLLTKEGYAKSVNIYTALHPYLEEQLAYVMIIRIKKVESEMVILNENGGLEGMTSNLARHLDIPTKQRVHLSEFCKNGEELGFINSRSLISKGDLKQREKEVTQILESENINAILAPWKSKNSLTFKLNGMLDSVFYGNMTLKILSFPWNSLNDQDHGISLKETSHGEETFEIPEEGPFEQGLSSEVKREFIPYSNRSTQRNLLGTLEPLSAGQFLNSPLSVTKEIRTGTYILSSNFDQENEGRRIKIKEEEETEEKENVTGRATRSRKMIRANLQESNTYSNLTTGTESLQRKIEKAIYSLPYASYHKAFRVLCLVFTISCGASLIGFKIQSFNVDRSVTRNTMIVSNSTKRMEKLLEINLFATRLLAVENGIIYNDRNAWNGNPDLKAITLRLFAKTNTEMIVYNQAIRDSIYKISSKFQPRFFKEIEVIERGVTADNVFKPARKTDLFALIDEITAALDKFASTVSNNNSFNGNEDLSFIRRNSRGDLLLAGEDIINIVSDDNKYRLDNSETTLKLLMVLASLFSLLILFLFGLIIHKFIQAREKFLNVVLRIEEEAISRHSLLVLNFCDQLYRAHMDGRKANISINHELAKISGGGQTYKRRTLHHSGFYRKEVTLILFAIILNILLYAGFIFTLPIVISHHKKMSLTVSRIVNSDIASYQSAFLYYQTYLYVSQNKSGNLRNITLAEQWNVTITTLNQMQTNFTKLAQELREEEDGSEVLSYLIGNECEIIIPMTAGTATSCPTALKGSVTKGLLQVSSYVMAVVQNVKNIFDSSARSLNDMRNALNHANLIYSEPYMLSYWIYAYATISDLLRTQLTEQYKAFDKSYGTLMICWGVLYMILGTLVWWGIDKSCVNEKKSWRKILRLIPVNIVKENKLLQSYLFSSQPLATF